MKGGKALIILAKYPHPDTVKTRLRGHLPDEKRIRIYEALLNNAVETLRDLPGVDTFICYSPSSGRSYFARFGLGMFVQSGGDVGLRMHHAMQKLFRRGYQNVVLVGVDIPDISGSIVLKAFSLLDETDLVFGPAMDGGYYLVGLNKPDPEIFRGIEWSTDRTLRESIARAESCKYRISFTERLSDVDTAEDLKRSRFRF